MVGGATVVALAAGSAAAGGSERTVASDPTTTAPEAEHSTTPSTAAPATTERPAITEHPRTTAAPPTTAAPSTTVAPPTTQPVTYTVTHIVDGDTLDVTPSDGSTPVRVRVVGIDAPEQGTCEADAATMALAGLVQDRQVVLTPGGDGEDTDAYGRSLRYVDLDGIDAGLRLIEDGFAISRYDSRDGYGAHAREAAYVAADAASPAFVCPPPPTAAPVPAPPPPPAPVPPPPPITPAPARSADARRRVRSQLLGLCADRLGRRLRRRLGQRSVVHGLRARARQRHLRPRQGRRRRGLRVSRRAGVHIESIGSRSTASGAGWPAQIRCRATS